MLWNSSLLLTSIVEILSYALLADQVSRQCTARLYVQLEYFLSFDCQVKYVLVNKGNKSLNLVHIFLAVAKILSTTHCLAPVWLLLAVINELELNHQVTKQNLTLHHQSTKW